MSQNLAIIQNIQFFAIIIHCGKHIQAGHYVSIIKRKEKWYICDDDEVNEITEDKIFVDSAYLLFYRQEEKDN